MHNKLKALLFYVLSVQYLLFLPLPLLLEEVPYFSLGTFPLLDIIPEGPPISG